MCLFSRVLHSVTYMPSSLYHCFVFRTLNRRNLSQSWLQCWSCGRMNTAHSPLSGCMPKSASSRALFQINMRTPQAREPCRTLSWRPWRFAGARWRQEGMHSTTGPQPSSAARAPSIALRSRNSWQALVRLHHQEEIPICRGKHWDEVSRILHPHPDCKLKSLFKSLMLQELISLCSHI